MMSEDGMQPPTLRWMKDAAKSFFITDALDCIVDPQGIEQMLL